MKRVYLEALDMVVQREARKIVLGRAGRGDVPGRRTNPPNEALKNGNIES